jgi:predicted methyltransferase
LTNRPLVLSARQVMPLLEARKQQAESVVTSLDLGMTRQEVMLDQSGAMLPSGSMLSWDEMAQIAANPEACWLVAEKSVRRIHAFSQSYSAPIPYWPQNLLLL